jgi:LemA protein
MTKEVATLWPLALGAFALGWIAWSFNRLVALRNLVAEAWSGIDVQLKRRHDLVPALVETVRGYRDCERGVLEDLTRLRSRPIDPHATRDLRDDENALSDRLRTFFALVEGYPALRADTSFLALQNQLSEIEDQIQYSRRYYSGSVRDYNTRVESFPSNLIARRFGFRQAEFFEIETATDRATPVVEFRP